MHVEGKQAAMVPASANELTGQVQAASPFLSIPARLFLRKDELSEWLGVSDTTIEEWMRRRVIPYAEIGRVRLFNVEDVKRAVQRFTVRAVGDTHKV